MSYFMTTQLEAHLNQIVRRAIEEEVDYILRGAGERIEGRIKAACKQAITKEYARQGYRVVLEPKQPEPAS